MIWCVDHDAQRRNLEIHALRCVGMDTKGYDSADSFWKDLQKECPELILMDADKEKIMCQWNLHIRLWCAPFLHRKPPFTEMPKHCTVKGGFYRDKSVFKYRQAVPTCQTAQGPFRR